MVNATLDELRARSNATGIPLWRLVRSERRKASPQDPYQARDKAAPVPLDVDGAVWRVVECGGGDAYGYSWSGESNARGVAADLGKMGFRPYCPMKLEYKIRKRRNREIRILVARPLFFGYLLVGESPRLPLSLRVHGKISAILPGWLDPEFVASVHSAELAGAWDATRGPAPGLFHAGAAVRIAEGPLAGFAAVVRQAERAGHVRLDVQMFGTSVQARVPVGCVEAA